MLKVKLNQTKAKWLVAPLMPACKFCLRSRDYCFGDSSFGIGWSSYFGANILEVGTTNGTSTDFDGNYTITVSGSDAVLEFSYVGFKTVSKTAAATLNVSMEEEATQLTDVVVIGYGTAKKSDLTGAVASVKSDELNTFSVLTGEQALQGRAAGVDISSEAVVSQVLQLVLP